MSELTTEQVQDRFLDRCWVIINEWNRILGARRDRTPHECIAGAVFTVLATLDGNDPDLPGFIVAPNPHPEDRAFREERRTDWYPENYESSGHAKADIGGELHDRLYERPGKGRLERPFSGDSGKTSKLTDSIRAVADECDRLGFEEAAYEIREAAGRIVPPREEKGFWERASRAALNFLNVRTDDKKYPEVSINHKGEHGRTHDLAVVRIAFDLEEGYERWVDHWDPGEPLGKRCGTCHAEKGEPCTGLRPKGLSFHASRRVGVPGRPS